MYPSQEQTNPVLGINWTACLFLHLHLTLGIRQYYSKFLPGFLCQTSCSFAHMSVIVSLGFGFGPCDPWSSNARAALGFCETHGIHSIMSYSSQEKLNYDNAGQCLDVRTELSGVSQKIQQSATPSIVGALVWPKEHASTQEGDVGRRPVGDWSRGGGKLRGLPPWWTTLHTQWQSHCHPYSSVNHSTFPADT